MTAKGICPIQTVFGILNGKWKHRILLELHPGPMRYNQLAASIGTISYKVLTQQLRELEANGLVHREVYPVIPPKVEYSLTETGRSLMPVLVAMRDWGADYLRRKNTEPCCFMMGTNPIVKPTNR